MLPPPALSAHTERKALTKHTAASGRYDGTRASRQRQELERVSSLDLVKKISNHSEGVAYSATLPTICMHNRMHTTLATQTQGDSISTSAAAHSADITSPVQLVIQ